MDTVTYPDPEVQEFLGDNFRLVRASLADKDPEVREIIKQYRTLWSPGFVVLDRRGTELRRFLGYQPAGDFLAELRVAVGKIRILHRDPESAYQLFRSVADLDPPAPVSAEALYWSGIAMFLRDGKEIDWLDDYWRELGERFPDSRWWTHANVWRIAAGN